MGNSPCVGRQERAEVISSPAGDSRESATATEDSPTSAVAPRASWATTTQQPTDHTRLRSDSTHSAAVIDMQAEEGQASLAGNGQSPPVVVSDLSPARTTSADTRRLKTSSSRGTNIQQSLPGGVEDPVDDGPVPHQTSTKEEVLRKTMAEYMERMHTAEARCRVLDDENKNLEALLADYRDRDLANQHDALRSSQPSRHRDESAETVEAQKKIIEDLQGQLATAADELKSLREQYNRRLKKQRAASAELRTEAGITIMQLREEKVNLTADIERLKKEMHELSRRQKAAAGPDGVADGTVDSDQDVTDGYASLIAELSGQVERLTGELRKAKKRIKLLQGPPLHPAASAPQLRAPSLDSADSVLS